ncbi:MAG: Fic family protein [Bacteroidales bacterium]|nr:Fic family protein [Bacteroidales bacterium]
MEKINDLIEEYFDSDIENLIDHNKFYLYSLITHSTAIEGSTVTEVENQLLFDEGIPANGKPIKEQMMNLDCKEAYDTGLEWARNKKPFTVESLCELSGIMLRRTGSTMNTPMGSFDSSKGELRLCNVTAGVGGKSYMSFLKVPAKLNEFCQWINDQRKSLPNMDCDKAYSLAFEAHKRLVDIHPWLDGNGRMSRLVMNMIEEERGLPLSYVDKREKASYIEALIKSREDETPQPFINFMLGVHSQHLRKELDNYYESLDIDPLAPSGGRGRR